MIDRYAQEQRIESIDLNCLGKGFAHIATQANVPIVPTFLANQEEMRWNPILWLWNLFRLGRLFAYLVQLDIPIFSSALNLIGTFIWFSVTWIQIPIPAKITLYIGDPVTYDLSRDTIDDVRHFLFAQNDLSDNFYSFFSSRFDE